VHLIDTTAPPTAKRFVAVPAMYVLPKGVVPSRRSSMATVARSPHKFASVLLEHLRGVTRTVTRAASKINGSTRNASFRRSVCHSLLPALVFPVWDRPGHNVPIAIAGRT
jgi:hypothetical protein